MLFVFVFHLFRFCFCLNCSVLFCWWIVLGVIFLAGGGSSSSVFLLFVLLCLCWSVLVMFGFLSSCIFLVCFCGVLCVSWSGLGVVIVLFFLFVLLVFFFMYMYLFLSVSYEHHYSPCNSSVLGLVKYEIMFLISVSVSCFLFLFCLLLFQDVQFFSVCSLVCFESQYYIFVMHLVFLLLSSFCFCCFGILSIFEFEFSKHLSEIRKIRNPQMKNEAKTDIWTRAVSTGVFTNSMFRVLKVCMIC